jgi:hypothetical protein
VLTMSSSKGGAPVAPEDLVPTLCGRHLIRE